VPLRLVGSEMCIRDRANTFEKAAARIPGGAIRHADQRFI
jgi:hypothetical protein